MTARKNAKGTAQRLHAQPKAARGRTSQAQAAHATGGRRDWTEVKLTYWGPGDEDEDNLIRRKLADVIRRLPKPVRVFAVENCSYTGFDRAGMALCLPGQCVVPSGFADRLHEIANVDFLRTGRAKDTFWLIQFRLDIPARRFDSIIAHELAHAWLNHDPLEPGGEGDIEIAACKLASKWGFVGDAADPSVAKEYLRLRRTLERLRQQQKRQFARLEQLNPMVEREMTLPGELSPEERRESQRRQREPLRIRSHPKGQRQARAAPTRRTTVRVARGSAASRTSQRP